MKQHRYSENCICNPGLCVFCEFNKHLNSYTKNVFESLRITCHDETLNNTATINIIINKY